MLLLARIVAAVTAIVVVINIAVGAMTDPDFLVPDLALAVLLAFAAVTPASRGASSFLVASLAFSLGVFAVALSTQIHDGETNWGLTALMAADLVALGGLLLPGLRREAAAG